MERAKRRLGIRHRKQFGSGRSFWYLPEASPTPRERDGMAAVAELAEMTSPGESVGPLNGSPHGKEADR